MTNWSDLGPSDQFPPGTKTCICVDGVSVAICNVEGELQAFSDACPHAGKPLADGNLHGRVLTCIYHDYAYDVVTGRNVVFPEDEPPLRKYPVRCTEAGHVEVSLPQKR